MEKVQNGLVTTDAPFVDLSKRSLSPAQQKYFTRLINILGRAEAEVESAKEKLTLAQGNAGDFVGCCAEEFGITLGLDGWRFDQGTLSFIQGHEEAGGE